MQGELLEIRAEFEPGTPTEIDFNVRGILVSYDAKQSGNRRERQARAGAAARWPKQRLILYADRTSLEVFAADGLTYLPFPINLDPSNTSLSLFAKGGTAEIKVARSL